MPGIQDLIQTFFQVEGLKNQRRELEVLEQNSLVQRTNTMASLATLITNPEARNAASMIVGGPQNLQDFITQAVGSVAPGVGVLERINAASGFAALPEDDQGMLQRIAGVRSVSGLSPSGVLEESLDEALLSTPVGEQELLDLSRTRRAGVAGTTPGRLRSDLTLADLPKEEHESFLRIQGGTELSKMDENQIAQWAASNAISWAQLEQNGALGLAEIRARLDIAQLQHDAVGAAGGAAGYSPNTLIGIMNDQLAAAGDTSKSRAERAMAITMFNSAADNLAATGAFNAPQRLDPDPDKMDNSISMMQRFLYGVGGAAAGGAAGFRVAGPKGAVVGAVGGFPAGAILGNRMFGGGSGGDEMGYPGAAFSPSPNTQQEAASVLQQLISSGAITPEILQQILQSQGEAR